MTVATSRVPGFNFCLGVGDVIGSCLEANDIGLAIDVDLRTEFHVLPVFNTTGTKVVLAVHWPWNFEFVVEGGATLFAKGTLGPVRGRPNSQLILWILNVWIFPSGDRKEHATCPGPTSVTMAGIDFFGFSCCGELDGGAGTFTVEWHRLELWVVGI